MLSLTSKVISICVFTPVCFGLEGMAFTLRQMSKFCMWLMPEEKRRQFEAEQLAKQQEYKEESVTRVLGWYRKVVAILVFCRLMKMYTPEEWQHLKQELETQPQS